MARKTIIALAAAMAAMLTIPTTDALARPGGGFHSGGFHGGFGGFRGGGVRFGAFRGGFHRGFVRNRFFVRHAPFFGYRAYARSCWHWVPTRYGLRRVWTCGGPYNRYY